MVSTMKDAMRRAARRGADVMSIRPRPLMTPERLRATSAENMAKEAVKMIKTAENSVGQ